MKPAPGPATRLEMAAETGTSITLEWHAPKVAYRPVYSVRYRIKGHTAWTTFHKTTTATKLDITGLKPKTTYEFEVETKNGN